jgi:hypothetical protein
METQNNINIVTELTDDQVKMALKRYTKQKDQSKQYYADNLAKTKDYYKKKNAELRQYILNIKDKMEKNIDITEAEMIQYEKYVNKVQYSNAKYVSKKKEKEDLLRDKMMKELRAEIKNDLINEIILTSKIEYIVPSNLPNLPKFRIIVPVDFIHSFKKDT